MAIIGGLAVLLALIRFSWQLGLFSTVLSLAFGLPLWCGVGGPVRLRWGFVASVVVFNGAVCGSITYLPVEHDADYLVVAAVLASFGYLWTSVAWANVPMSRPNRGRANLLVVAFFAATVSMVVTQWPWHLASWISSPGLNRLADRIEAGGTLRTGGEWAGLYRIRAVIPYPGGVNLFTIPPGNGSAGFARGLVRPRPIAGWEKIGSDYNDSGRWHTFNSE